MPSSSSISPEQFSVFASSVKEAGLGNLALRGVGAGIRGAGRVAAGTGKGLWRGARSLTKGPIGAAGLLGVGGAGVALGAPPLIKKTMNQARTVRAPWRPQQQGGFQ